jgi:membrane AbrB-like protein
MGRLLPLALACIAAVSVACTALAWLLSRLVHIPLSDAYLATTPGGINAVLVTAAAYHADVSLISSVQSMRLFSMVLLAPLIIRVLARWLDHPNAVTAEVGPGCIRTSPESTRRRSRGRR